jgi:hypothetical protein
VAPSTVFSVTSHLLVANKTATNRQSPFEQATYRLQTTYM